MFLTREKEETLARPANYEATLWLPCLVAVAAAAADVYLVARTIGTQDGKASPIYSAREPVRFSGRTRKRLVAAGRASRYLHLVSPPFLRFESRTLRP